MISWNYISQKDYDDLDESLKTPDILFYIFDSHSVYRGTEDYTNKIAIYKDYVKNPQPDILYIDANYLQGVIWDGTKYIKVLDAFGYSSIEASPMYVADIQNINLEDIKSSIIEDLWNKMDRVEPEHTGEVIVVDHTGNAQLSGTKIGGAEFAVPTTDKLLATEAGAMAKIEKYLVELYLHFYCN